MVEVSTPASISQTPALTQKATKQWFLHFPLLIVTCPHAVGGLKAHLHMAHSFLMYIKVNTVYLGCHLISPHHENIQTILTLQGSRVREGMHEER